MSRSARLFELLQAFRRHRRAVSASQLAAELGVSKRTVYRDIACLVQSGAAIEGEPGVGYVLRPGFFLPPVALDQEELDAVVLGLRWVSRRGDAALARSAADALAKIVAVLPPTTDDPVTASGWFVGGRSGPAHFAAVRQAVREERKLRLAYADETGAQTERVVWPIAIGFFETADMLAAWCELRDGFRHFRLDRIARADLSSERYPKRRPLLLADWRLADRQSGRCNHADRN
jgi:predicted DNA-binding transcriptional regulator YafY